MSKPKGIGTLAAAAIVAALVAGGGSGLAATRVGTDAGETLAGTANADRLTGKGGDDVLKGLAGDDVYHFEDGFGRDRLEEKARYKVRGRRLPGGKDTLDFSGVTGGRVLVYLIPEWGSYYHTAVRSYPIDVVDLGASRVENAVGSAFVGDTVTRGDYLTGGGGPNVLRAGGGGYDNLLDVGGSRFGPQGYGGIPASDDTYADLARNSDTITIRDYGGDRDTVDLRPLTSSDVTVHLLQQDLDAQAEGIAFVRRGTSAAVAVLGQFGVPFGSATSGRIELFRFADLTVTADQIDLLLNQGVSAASQRGQDGPSADVGGLRTDGDVDDLLADLRRDLERLPDPTERPRRR